MEVLKRMGNVFVSPDVCFKSLEEKKINWLDFILPILLLIIMAVVSMNLTSDLVRGVQVEAIQNLEQLTDAQKQDALSRVDAPLAQNLKYVSVVIMVPLAAVFTAAIFLLVGNFIGGGKQSFGKLMVSALLIQLISIPESIIKLVMMLQKETLQVFVGLGSFFNAPEMSSFGFQFLAQFEFFKIWRIILWVVAFKMLYKYDTKKSTLLVVITFLLGMVLSALMASMQAGRM